MHLSKEKGYIMFLPVINIDILLYLHDLLIIGTESAEFVVMRALYKPVVMRALYKLVVVGEGE